MKKVSLLAFILSATAAHMASADTRSSAADCPKAFQGFHLGGNIGYGVGTSREKHPLPGGGVAKNNLGFKGIDGGVGVGYTHRFGNYALGIAFDANWANTKGKSDNIGAKARLQNSLQLYARTGYVIGGQTMPFVGLGWDNSRWKISDINPPVVHQHKRMDGLLWKAGVDFLATKHVVVGLEYTGSVARKKFNKVGDVTFRPQSNRFAFTAKVVY